MILSGVMVKKKKSTWLRGEELFVDAATVFMVLRDSEDSDLHFILEYWSTIVLNSMCS